MENVSEMSDTRDFSDREFPVINPQVPQFHIPEDKQLRKEAPMARGCLDYFSDALFLVANVSFKANDQHNPGEEMHWSWGKSNDHADCIMRHLADRGTLDNDGLRHSAKLAWRALALLQEELVAAGLARLPKAARLEAK